MKRKIEIASLSLLLLSIGCADRSEKLYPLAEGRAWTYQIAIESAWGSTNSATFTLTNMPKRKLNGKSVVPQKTDVENQTFFSFVGSDGTGIFILGSQGPKAAEPQILDPVAYLLKKPYEQGTKWQYQSSGVAALETDTPPTLEATIESTDETVTVPAGTFSHCIKVVGRGEKRSGYMNRSTVAVEETSWFCPKIGLVRSIGKVGGRGSSLQLQSYVDE